MSKINSIFKGKKPLDLLRDNSVPLMFIVICAICTRCPASLPATCSMRSSPGWAGTSS